MNEKSPAKTGLSTWVRVVFGLSLALNLLVVGLLIGTVVRFGDKDGRRPPPHSMGTAMYHELPHEDRKALRKNSQARASHSKEFRAAEAEAIAAALRTSPFDKGAVQAVLDGQAEHRLKWQETTQTAWLDQVSQMSMEARLEYADRLYKALTQPRGRDRHGREQRRKQDD
jgi:uncharacterized membrane protein